jgi:metal-responsive CopG/Arc/MetJ family transcriptional regulator
MKHAHFSETRSSRHAERFTVSLPRHLYETGEEIRTRRGWNRSEFVAYLYERFLEDIEREDRLARYAAAYGQMPETESEKALTELSMDVLASEAP